MEIIERNRNKIIATSAAVGLFVVGVIGGWLVGDSGKLSGTEAAGTANAVSTSCDATKAALVATSDYWRRSSDNWGSRALTAEAILTGVPPVPSATVLPVTITNIPEGWVCSAPTGTMTPRPYVRAATATATRTATATMEPTLALRNTDILTSINTRPAPTATVAPTIRPTDIPTATEVPNTQIPPTEVFTATPPIPTPAPTNPDVIPTATQSTP